MEQLDFQVFGMYLAVIICLGIAIGCRQKATTESYFLASKSLPWWILGSSIFAANISAEHLIGTTGSAYAMGITIGAYELTGALALVIAAVVAIPYFVRNNITTMPQFLASKYDNRVRTMFAVFWIVVYTFINLTAVSYMGALAFQTIGIPLNLGVYFLITFAVLYSALGGIASRVWTDFIQVAVLMGAGIACSYFAIDAYSTSVGASNIVEGMSTLYQAVPGHFDMILEPGNEHYSKIPGHAGVFGIFLGSLAYFSFNQFIIQGALSAKNVNEAQKGMLFAAGLKLLMPFVVIIPGIIAFSMTKGSLTPSDTAYPWLITHFLPTGFQGLVMAALFAAIVSTLAAILNSIATMFTIDIVQVNKPGLTDKTLVNIARAVVCICGVVGAVLAVPLLSDTDQAYHFIQEFVGFVTPAMLVIFFAAMYWKADSVGAIMVTMFSVVSSTAVMYFVPDLPWLERFLMVLVGGMILYWHLAKDCERVKIDYQSPSTWFKVLGALVVITVFAVYFIL